MSVTDLYRLAALGAFYTGSTEFREHIVRTGVNFKFGAREESVPVK